MRGAYHTKVSKVTGKFVKPPPSLKFNTEERSVYITCATGAGKVIMWHEVQGTWNGEVAAKMYSGWLGHGPTIFDTS